MDRNSEILPGMCIVCGTEEGLFATASKLPQQEVHIVSWRGAADLLASLDASHSTPLAFDTQTCTDEAGTSSSVILPLDPKACVAEGGCRVAERDSGLHT